MADDGGAMGPVSYVIVEYPQGSRMSGEGLRQLIDLSDRGLIRVLDLLFVTRTEDGPLQVVDLQDVDHDGTLDVTVFDGVPKSVKKYHSGSRTIDPPFSSSRRIDSRLMMVVAAV